MAGFVVHTAFAAAFAAVPDDTATPVRDASAASDDVADTDGEVSSETAASVPEEDAARNPVDDVGSEQNDDTGDAPVIDASGEGVGVSDTRMNTSLEDVGMVQKDGSYRQVTGTGTVNADINSGKGDTLKVSDRNDAVDTVDRTEVGDIGEPDRTRQEACETERGQYLEQLYKKVQGGLRITTVRTSADDDVITITNSTDGPILLDKWQIRRRTAQQTAASCDADGVLTKYTIANAKSSSLLCEFGAKCGGAGRVVMPGTTVSWVGFESGRVGDDVIVGGKEKIIADDNAIILVNPDGRIVDVVAWGDLKDSFNTNSLRNPEKQEYIDRGDGEGILRNICEHRFLRVAPCIPSYDGSRVFLSEIFPNPDGDETEGEYVELYNPGTAIVNLHGWRLADAKNPEGYVFPYGTTVPAGGYLVVTRRQSGIALNNTGETVTVTASDGTTVVDSVTVAGSASEGASFGRTPDGGWRWSRQRTPGIVNIFDMLPRIRDIDVPRKVYRDVAAVFAADAAVASGRTAAYRWDFGDGHRSYLARTRHTYNRDGTYTVSLRVSDGVENVTKSWQIRVARYPRRAVALDVIAPNPKGRDTGMEYLVLRNADRRRIDFRLWSVATGSTKDKLVNHPFRDVFGLGAGDTRKLTARDAAFTLPNKGGIVQIRRPDGSVATTVAYGPPKGTASVPQDAMYRRSTDGWVWDMTDAPTKKRASRTVSRPADIAAILQRAWGNDYGTIATQPAILPDAPSPIVAIDRGWAAMFMHRIDRLIRTLAVLAVPDLPPSDAMTAVVGAASDLPPRAPHPAVVALAMTGLTPHDSALP